MRRTAETFIRRLRHMSAVAACALAVVALWPATALADVAPVPTVDPKLIVIAVAFGAVVVIAVIALLVIKHLRRQRTAQGQPGDGPQSDGEGGSKGR